MTLSSNNPLFQPFRLKNLTLKNRFVMAPMTRNFAHDGVVGDDVAHYYRRRAANEVGLIISEGTVVERPTAANDPRVPHFYGEHALRGWKNVIDNVHTAGGVMGPQLWHVGSVAGGVDGSPAANAMEGPSGLGGPDTRVGRVMTDEDIADTISAFARAAGHAKQLGFDVVALHGAHGYLFDQFFWQATNKRTDRHGGSTLAERTTFATETVRAIREAIGPDVPIIFRISQFKTYHYSVKLAKNPNELAAWLQPLVEAGVDVVDCSQRRFWEPEFADVDGPQGLNLAGWAKKLTGAVTMSVGSVGLSGDVVAALFDGEGSQPTSLDELVRRMGRNEFDLIGIGRALLNDPAWVRKVKDGNTAGLRAFDPSSLAELV